MIKTLISHIPKSVEDLTKNLVKEHLKLLFKWSISKDE